MSSIESDDVASNERARCPDPNVDREGPTHPNSATREFERIDQGAAHEPDRSPTEEEERLADEIGPVEPEVAEHYREMSERGANTEGEAASRPRDGRHQAFWAGRSGVPHGNRPDRGLHELTVGDVCAAIERASPQPNASTQEWRPSPSGSAS